ncbi:MAG TPA: endonuclease domain-containing protein [Candidatus Agrococcus pullicola]|uniref:Endonuclease domain-containing protein n=1 Tax=Candidatus Agrococcus pullicola TaxID=2838429 RepID=A0A9D1YVY6_9MICO|nr:endonuclease domain-containing protein [Candidatus Agrococcus pullicola]
MNGRAESGLETLLRLACEDQGWDVEIQVPFRGGRVDIVINGWLFIEVDGSQFHDVGEQARKDRIRNKQIVQAGFRWHRFGYADVVHRLDETLAVIRAILLAGAPNARAAALA